MELDEKVVDLDMQVADLDMKITRLKVEYEQYFMRILKREPQLLRTQTDKLIRVIGNEHMSNTALKFRYRQLVDKYNAFKHYWTRTLKEIEDGTYRRSAEASGIRVSAPRSSAGVTTLAEPASKPQAAKEKEKPAAVDNKNLISYEDAYMRKLYKTYMAAKEKCRESTKGIKYEDLAKAVRKQREMAEKKYGTKRLDFKVNIKGGKTTILVIPKKSK